MKKTFSLCMVMLLMCTQILAGCSSVSGENSQPIPTADAAVDEAKDAGGYEDTPQAEGSPEKPEDKDDPGASEADTGSSDTEENEELEKAIMAYASAIKEQAADPQFPVLGFTLIHLDADDVPELAIAFGDSHAGGVGFYGLDEAGRVNEICATGSLGLAYYEKGNGIAYGWYTGQGETCYNICIVKDGKLAEHIMPVIAIQYDENFEESGHKYFLEEDGEESEVKDISKEEFEEILAPYAPEKREYRELECSNLYDAHKVSDIEQALRDSLAKEDDLPKPDMEFFNTNIVKD